MSRWRSWLLSGMITLVGGTCLTAQAQLCLPDLDAKTPFSTPEGRERLSGAGGIAPSDVFLHAQTLRRAIVAMGVKVENSTPGLLPLAEVLPRHNYTLAYDLLILLQLWWQEHEQVAHMPPTLSYPQEVVSADVFRWVDASLALVHCFDAQTARHRASEAITRDATLASSDVYLLMSALVHAISQKVSLASLRAMHVHRLNQILYFTQDAMLEITEQSLVRWSPNVQLRGARGFDQNVPTVMAAKLLQEIQEINHQALLTITDDILYGDDDARTHNLTFLLSQVFGEIQDWTSAQGMRIDTPPLAPVIHRNLDDSAIIERLHTLHTLVHTAGLVEGDVHEEPVHD